MQAFVTYLKNQSPSPQLPNFGHGWIQNENGKRWHPANSQAELLAELTSKRKHATWITRLRTLLFK